MSPRREDPIRIGISKPRGFRPDEFLLSRAHRDSVDLSEWDVLDLLDIRSRSRTRVFHALEGSRHRTVISVSSAYLLATADALPEKFAVLGEMAESFFAEAILVRVASRLSSDPEGLASLLRTFRPPLPLWLDHGREPDAAPGELRGSDFVEIVDPLWHRVGRQAQGCVFKLHGWHPSRWVRCYGPTQLERLRRSCLRHRPRAVLFAHSMRNEEALGFTELLRRSAGQARR